MHNDEVIIDCAVYRDGHRENASVDRESLEQVIGALTGDNEFIWIGMFEPTAEELESVAGPLKLHPLAVEDAIKAHQRPKAERFGDHLFMSIRTVSYRQDDVTTGEVNVFLGDHYLLTVRHGSVHELAEVRRRAEDQRSELSHGPTAALYAVVDSIVDDYEIVAAELETDVQEVEESVFSHVRTSDSSRIYRLKRETLEFRRAVAPLREPIRRFATEAMPEDSRVYFRDIGDHLSRVTESIDATDHLLDNALSAHLAQLSLQQNDDMRKLAAGATLFAIPTMIAGIYGMNFTLTSFQQWSGGFWVTVGVSVGLMVLTFRAFRKSGWL